MIIRTDYKKALTRELIILGVVIIIFVTFFILFRANINKEAESIATLQSQRSLLIQSTEGLSILKKQWDQARLYKDDVFLLVPSKDDLVEYNNRLKEVAAGDDVVFTFSFGNEEPGAGGGLNLIAFSATAEGRPSQLISFMKHLEEQFFSIRIDSLDMRNQERSDVMRLSFNGYVYFK